MRADGASGTMTGLLPAVCWRTVASFVGWWTCCVWTVITGVGIAMAHAGAASFA